MLSHDSNSNIYERKTRNITQVSGSKPRFSITPLPAPLPFQESKIKGVNTHNT